MCVCVCTITVYVFLPVYGPLVLLAHNTAPQTGPPQGPSDSACVCLSPLCNRVNWVYKGAAKMAQLHVHTLPQPTDMHTHLEMYRSCVQEKRQHACVNSYADNSRAHTENICACKNAYNDSHLPLRPASPTKHAHTHTHSLKAPT